MSVSGAACRTASIFRWFAAAQSHTGTGAGAGSGAARSVWRTVTCRIIWRDLFALDGGFYSSYLAVSVCSARITAGQYTFSGSGLER